MFYISVAGLAAHTVHSLATGASLATHSLLPATDTAAPMPMPCHGSSSPSDHDAMIAESPSCESIDRTTYYSTVSTADYDPDLFLQHDEAETSESVYQFDVFHHFNGVGTELGALSLLEVLRLDANEIIGEISTQVGKLVNFLHLDVSENRVSFALPSELDFVRLLQTLDAHGNALLGPVRSTHRNWNVEESPKTSE